VFFAMHDPTTLNRQGADVGTQYRSVIYYGSEAQRATAEALVRELDAKGIWGGPIVTQVEPAPPFFPAEPYHQQYYQQNPNAGYCQVVIAPKVAKLRQQFAHRLRDASPRA
jgi:peptide-methionine (S)-S-oxide reductase